MTEPAPSQQQVDTMLSWGVLFSILWLLGVGSLYAFVCGPRAKRIIDASSGAIVWRGRAWWCLIVGGLGMAIWFPIVVVGIVNRVR